MKILTLFLVVLLIAVFFDFEQGKIPNILILMGMFAGLIHLINGNSVVIIGGHILGILLPLLLLYPLFKIGTLGAGDIKLLSLLGFYLPFMDTLICIFNAFFIAAIISFLMLLWRRSFKERILYFISYVRDCIYWGRFQYYYTDRKKEEEKNKIHFSLPVFISVAYYIYNKGM